MRIFVSQKIKLLLVTVFGYCSIFIFLVSVGNGEGLNNISLSYSGSARSIGMAEAAGVMTDDSGIVFQNPSATADLDKSEVAFFYRTGVDGEQLSNLVVGYPTFAGVFCLGVVNFNAGDMELIDSQGNEWTANAQCDYMVLLGYAKRFSSWFCMGVNLKYITSTILENYNDKAITEDVGISGILPILNEKIKIGLAALNISGKLKYLEQEEPLPTIYKVSIGYINKHVIQADYVKNMSNNATQTINVGGEYVIEIDKNTRCFLRSGYKFEIEDDIAESLFFGFGIKYKKVTVDYAFGVTDYLNKTNNVSIKLSF